MSSVTVSISCPFRFWPAHSYCIDATDTFNFITHIYRQRVTVHMTICSEDKSVPLLRNMCKYFEGSTKAVPVLYIISATIFSPRPFKIDQHTRHSRESPHYVLFSEGQFHRCAQSFPHAVAKTAEMNFQLRTFAAESLGHRKWPRNQNLHRKFAKVRSRPRY